MAEAGPRPFWSVDEDSASGVPSSWPEQLDAAAALGSNCFRLSLEWARVEPSEDGGWDEAAWTEFAAICAGCRLRGMAPHVTLWHYTHPQWVDTLAVSGGGDNRCRRPPQWFLSPRGRARFARFAAEAARRLGRWVRTWTTLNEARGGGLAAAASLPARARRASASTSAFAEDDCPTPHRRPCLPSLSPSPTLPFSEGMFSDSPPPDASSVSKRPAPPSEAHSPPTARPTAPSMPLPAGPTPTLPETRGRRGGARGAGGGGGGGGGGGRGGWRERGKRRRGGGRDDIDCNACGFERRRLASPGGHASRLCSFLLHRRGGSAESKTGGERGGGARGGAGTGAARPRRRRARRGRHLW